MTAGDLAPGSRLPTVRALAKALGVSPTTVNQAWQSLGRAGVLETRGRNGTHVRPEPITRGPQRYRRMRAAPGPLTPRPLARHPRPATSCPCSARCWPGWPAGRSPRATSSSRCSPSWKPSCASAGRSRPAALTVVDGAMDALDRLTALTVRLGEVVLVEEAAFPPVLDLLDTRRGGGGPDGDDDQGMVPTALERPR